MVADVLHYTETPESTLKLSELVHTKTKGNPFFTISFLTKLYQTELIVRTVSMRKASDVHERPAVWLLELRLTRCLFVVGATVVQLHQGLLAVGPGEDRGHAVHRQCRRVHGAGSAQAPQRGP
jgi:hypothetical protein